MSNSTQPTPIILRTTTNPTETDLEAFLNLLSTSYLQTPLTTSFITEIDSTPPPYPSTTITPERLKAHFTLGITAVAKSNVLLTFATSHTPSTSSAAAAAAASKPIAAAPTITSTLTSSAALSPAFEPTTPTIDPPATKDEQILAAALFEPPSFTGIPPSLARRTPGPILQSYRHLAAHLKTKHLSIPETGPHSYDQPAAPSQSSAGPSEDPYPGDFNKEIGSDSGEIRSFYHCAFLPRRSHADHTSTAADGKATGDDDGAKVADAVAAIVAEYQGKAGGEGVPIWLLVSDPVAKREFEALGFRELETARVGVGLVDHRGWPVQAVDRARGEGVQVWAMIWEA